VAGAGNSVVAPEDGFGNARLGLGTKLGPDLAEAIQGFVQ
jgi:hypothetical protein